MTPLLPQVKAKDLIRISEKLGFVFDRQSGSHSVIPIHPAKNIKRKTLYGIIRDMGLKQKEFKELL